MVTAKFKCISKKQTSDGYVIEMAPVISGSSENDQFFRYTPFGKLEMGTVNQAAADEFYPGHEYYISFSRFVDTVAA
jgi:hypothetical protein